MGFLKKLFGGGNGDNKRPKDGALYFYVKPKMCKEILQIRLHPGNDLSRTDDEQGYFVRKVAQGARCPFPVEITVYFDTRRNVTGKDIENGEFATEEEYETFIAAKSN